MIRPTADGFEGSVCREFSIPHQRRKNEANRVARRQRGEHHGPGRRGLDDPAVGVERPPRAGGAVNGRHYFECSCGAHEHTLVWDEDVWEQDGEVHREVYASVMLNQYLPWWRRLWVAAKYAAGVATCRGGHFDAFILRPEDAERLAALARGEGGER